MFGKKNKKENESNKQLGNVEVIPDIFYGGKDPVIYHKNNQNTKLGSEKKFTKKDYQSSNHFFSGLIHNKKFLIISGVITFLIVVGLISWYYIDQAVKASRPVAKVEEPKVVEDIPQVVEEQKIEVIENKEIQVIEEAQTEVTVEELPDTIVVTPVVFPDIVLVDGPDIDGDKLTDLEEEIYGSDSGVWDTDKDGYYDGQEVINLYNPGGAAPVKLIDSGFVNEYINPTWQYRLYTPVVWDIGEVDPEQRQVLFSSITGDYMEVRVFEKKETQTFQEWFAENVRDQSFQDIVQFTNRFEEIGYKRSDQLVAYFPRQKVVYVLIYHTGINETIYYRYTIQMMMQSFRPSKTLVQLPGQEALPKPPSFEDTTDLLGVELVNPEDVIFDTKNTSSTVTSTL